MSAACSEHSWYAVQVKARRELQVAIALRSKGYEAFVPLHKVRKQWRERVKIAEMPLFPSYTFCRFDPEIKVAIVTTPGVARIIGFGHGPVAISPSEIDSLRIASASGLACAPHCFLQVGQRVEVIRGPLTGVRGIFSAGGRKNRIVLSIALVRASAAVEVDESAVVVAV